MGGGNSEPNPWDVSPDIIENPDNSAEMAKEAKLATNKSGIANLALLMMQQPMPTPEPMPMPTPEPMPSSNRDVVGLTRGQFQDLYDKVADNEGLTRAEFQDAVDEGLINMQYDNHNK